MDMISAYRDVGSYRGAAAICGTTHKTVKRIIELHEAGGTPVGKRSRARNYDGVTDLVAKRVKDTSGRISAKRLLPAARAGLCGVGPELPPPGRRRQTRYSVPNRLIGHTVTVLVDARTLRVVEPVTGEVFAEHTVVAPGEPASSMTITAARVRTSHTARPDPEPPQRRRSSGWGQSPRRSSPAPRRPGSPS